MIDILLISSFLFPVQGLRIVILKAHRIISLPNLPSADWKGMNEVQNQDHIVDMPQPLGIYAGELLSRAEQYLIACKRTVGDRLEPDTPFPTYYLLSHSLELFLKAFLATKGSTKPDLKKNEIRHSVEKLLIKCTEKGMPLVENLDEMAARLEIMNSDFDFRYPTGYILSVPPFSECLPIMEALQEMLVPFIRGRVFRARLKFASDTRDLRPHQIRWSD